LTGRAGDLARQLERAPLACASLLDSPQALECLPWRLDGGVLGLEDLAVRLPIADQRCLLARLIRGSAGKDKQTDDDPTHHHAETDQRQGPASRAARRECGSVAVIYAFSELWRADREASGVRDADHAGLLFTFGSTGHTSDIDALPPDLPRLEDGGQMTGHDADRRDTAEPQRELQ
jgi:hypothetical protein